MIYFRVLCFYLSIKRGYTLVKSVVILLLFSFFNLNAQPQQHLIFNADDGLEIDMIRAINFDNDGFLWLSGENLDIRKIVLTNKNLVLQRFDGNAFDSVELPHFKERILIVNQIHKRQDGTFIIRAELDRDTHKYIFLHFDPSTTKFQPIKFLGSVNNPTNLSKLFSYDGEDYFLLQNSTNITVCRLNKNLSITPLFSYKTGRYIVDVFARIVPLKDYVIISENQDDIKIFNWDGQLLKSFEHLRTKIKEESYLWIDEVLYKDDKMYLFFYDEAQLYIFNESELAFEKSSENSILQSQNLKLLNDEIGHHLIVSENEKIINLLKIEDGNLKIVVDNLQVENFNGTTIASRNLNEELWIGSDKNELHYIKLPTNDIKTYLGDRSLRALTSINDNEILAATENDGWHKVNLNTHQVTYFKANSNSNYGKPYSTRNFVKINDQLWASDDNKFCVVDIQTEKLKHYEGNEFIVSYEKFNDSILVFSNTIGQLNTFNVKDKSFEVLLDTDSLYLYDVSTDKNIVLASTDKGVLAYDFKSKQSKLYTKDDGLSDDFYLMTDYDPELGFLVGSRSGFIESFNSLEETFKTIYNDDLNAGIATIVPYNNKLWISTFNGLVYFDKENSTSVRFSKKDGLSDNEANRYSALKTKEGIVVGSLNGLNYFKPESLVKVDESSELIITKTKQYDKNLNQFYTQLNKQQLNSGSTFVLPAENRSFELYFALNNHSLSKDYNYRYRINNSEWVDLKDESNLRFPSIAPGEYNLEIEALNFAKKQISKPLVVTIKANNFFYKTLWFYIAISLLIILILLYIINQARLRRKLQEEYSSNLLISQEEERNRIAKELHDSVGQQLTLIKRKAQNKDQKDISELTHNALEDVRSISRGLYPALLKQLGLSESIEHLVHEFDESNEIFFSVSVEDIDAYFNESESLNIYRFIQETLTNISKHAKANSVSVNLSTTNKMLILSIKDDGIGFQLSNKLKFNSLGLKTLNERIRILKGDLFIESRIGSGTEIKSEIPLKNE
ncbi:MAG: hypothetical protein KJO22_09680 [Bacteroidia bacterium]|nr:hypothetical protein [Bacteroidia bacterium]